MFLFFGGIIFALFGVLGCADLVQKKKKLVQRLRFDGSESCFDALCPGRYEGN